MAHPQLLVIGLCSLLPLVGLARVVVVALSLPVEVVVVPLLAAP
jgi:hypothetical protein